MTINNLINFELQDLAKRNKVNQRLNILKSLINRHNKKHNEKFRLMDSNNIKSLDQCVTLVNGSGEKFNFNTGILTAIEFLRVY